MLNNNVSVSIPTLRDNFECDTDIGAGDDDSSFSGHF